MTNLFSKVTDTKNNAKDDKNRNYLSGISLFTLNGPTGTIIYPAETSIYVEKDIDKLERACRAFFSSNFVAVNTSNFSNFVP